MNKSVNTWEDLLRLYVEQLDFLEVSAEAFDNGRLSEAKRLSLHLRILLHDTAKQKSLLGQLGVKGITRFYSSITPGRVSGPIKGLVMITVGPKGGGFIAPLDDFPPDHKFQLISFDEYWHEIVFVDKRGIEFSRADIVLTMSEQDGGAHVDTALDEDYDALTRKNSLGWVYGVGSEPGEPVSGEVLAAVRQITHEVLKTLISNYPEHLLVGRINMGGIVIEPGFRPGMLLDSGFKDSKNKSI